MSAGEPNLPRGTDARTRSNSSALLYLCIMAVSVYPGVTEFTNTPDPAYSSARARVRPSRPALLAE